MCVLLSLTHFPGLLLPPGHSGSQLSFYVWAGNLHITTGIYSTDSTKSLNHNCSLIISLSHSYGLVSFIACRGLSVIKEGVFKWPGPEPKHKKCIALC